MKHINRRSYIGDKNPFYGRRHTEEARDKISQSNKKGIEFFLEKSKIIHGEKYDYSKVIYKHSRKKICIICKKHGEFWQMPYSHLEGRGCRKCSIERKKSNFIELSKNKWNNLFDYSKTDYKNNSTKVCIICKKHGEFWKNPKEHLYKEKGCPFCSKSISNGELAILRFLENKNIKYERQKTFENCLFIEKLKFDFFIPELNTCIEFDGEQHFLKRSRFYEEVNEKRDLIKNEFCNTNKIKLIRISYKDLGKIENILNEYIL
jgi:very-short-patch-repair endonuclease